MSDGFVNFTDEQFAAMRPRFEALRAALNGMEAPEAVAVLDEVFEALEARDSSKLQTALQKLSALTGAVQAGLDRYGVQPQMPPPVAAMLQVSAMNYTPAEVLGVLVTSYANAAQHITEAHATSPMMLDRAKAYGEVSAGLLRLVESMQGDEFAELIFLG